MMNSLISIIIPVYNVEKYICRCLDSVLRQTYYNYEIILVNDGSTDESESICKKYQKEESKITLLCQENQGLSSARNSGIEIAKGDYITFIDSDDCVCSNYLEKLLLALEENDADISFCGRICFQNEFSDQLSCRKFDGIRVYSGREACKKLFSFTEHRVDYVVAWGKLYKKELFKKHRYPVGRIHEDEFLTYKLFYDSLKVAEIGDCLYGYYQNLQGITGSAFSIKRYDGIVAYEEAIRFFEEKSEVEISELINIRKKALLAEYSVRSRKAGFYNQLLQQYKVSLWRAIKTLKEIRGIDSYEYFMFEYYPGLVKLEAYLRKIKRMIIKTDNC